MPIIGNTPDLSGTGTQSAASQAKLDEDLNRFLNLLVTQLKNQDPLDPLDANEFTSQLVQFASVEQQIFQNSNLEKLLNLQQTAQVAQMVNYIGTKVEALGQKVPLENGKAEFTYVMPTGVAKGNVIIAELAGLYVFTADANTSAGKHGISWDGIDKNGNLQPDGIYTVLVSAQDPQGNLIPVEHTIFGTVSGAGADEGNVFLFLGDDLIVDQDKVLSVKEPNVTLQ